MDRLSAKPPFIPRGLHNNFHIRFHQFVFTLHCSHVYHFETHVSPLCYHILVHLPPLLRASGRQTYEQLQRNPPSFVSGQRLLSSTAAAEAPVRARKLWLAERRVEICPHWLELTHAIHVIEWRHQVWTNTPQNVTRTGHLPEKGLRQLKCSLPLIPDLQDI